MNCKSFWYVSLIIVVLAVHDLAAEAHRWPEGS